MLLTSTDQKIGLPDETEHNPDKELIPRQYIESLIRIAILQYVAAGARCAIASHLRAEPYHAADHPRTLAGMRTDRRCCR